MLIESLCYLQLCMTADLEVAHGTMSRHISATTSCFPDQHHTVLTFSLSTESTCYHRVSGVISLPCRYVAYLFFQLKTHKAMFNPEEEDEEEPAMSLTAAVIGLTGITVVVAISAE